LALTGCATTAQQEAERLGQTSKAAIAQLKSCMAPIAADSRYARVYEKLGVATLADFQRMPTAAQLADAEPISDADIRLGLDWYAQTQACGAPAIEALGRVEPDFQVYFADADAEATDIIGDITSGQIRTYGQLNTRIASLKQREKITATEIANNIKARLQAQHQAEVVEREAETEAVVSTIGAIAVAVASRGHASIAHLATRQSELARLQRTYAARHPDYVIVHRIRTMQCNGAGQLLRCSLREAQAATPTQQNPATQTGYSPQPVSSSPLVSADYRIALSNWLEAHKQYPESARQASEQGRAILRFRLDRDGRVLEYAIVAPTGYADLDASIAEMMRGAVMPPFPPSMTMPEIEVSVTISFGLTQSTNR
jgi:TonB family protein